MSEKFDFSHSRHKYNVSPSQLFSTPPPSSISSARPRVPSPSSTLPTMPTTNPTYQLVPASDPARPIDDDATSSSPTTRLLVSPSIHAASFHTPLQGTHTLTIHPTLLVRLIALALLSSSFTLLVSEGAFRSVPALFFVSLAVTRTIFAIAFPAPRTARWRGSRGINAAVDAGLVVVLLVTTIVAFGKRNWSRASPEYRWQAGNEPGCIVTWVATSLYALAALDTGSPDRFYIKMVRLSLDVNFWFREDAMVTDKWDVEARDAAGRPEMGEGVVLLG